MSGAENEHSPIFLKFVFVPVIINQTHERWTFNLSDSEEKGKIERVRESVCVCMGVSASVCISAYLTKH